VDARTDQRNQRDFRRDIRFGRATNRGLTIDTIDNSSIFFRSGIRRGDIIVSLHGQSIRSDADFHRVILLYPGQRVPVIVLRNGREERIFVEVPREYAQTQRTIVNRPVGAQAVLGVQFDVQARNAAVVRDVTPRSPAEQAGLQRGDVIVALNGAQIMGYPDAISVVRSMQPGDRIEIILDRNQREIQTEAILAGQPAGPLRTATRDADAYVEREVVPVEPRPRVIIDGRYDDGSGRYYNDRDYDRDGDYDRDDGNYRGRSLRGRLFDR
jgi:S1-C subfamily serine protease